MNMMRKAFEGQIIEVEAGKREIVACISTAAVDRDGEVVMPMGLVKKNYSGLTVFYNHDTALPIGSALWVKHSGGRVLAKYRTTDKTQFGRDMFALAQDGILNGYSIGFMPREYSAPSSAEIAGRPELKDVQRIYRQWELLEFSLVGIPANPEAVTLAISKKVSPETLELIRGGMQQIAADGSRESSDGRTIDENGKLAEREQKLVLEARAMRTEELIQIISARLRPVEMDKVIQGAFDRCMGKVE